jgi:hypothetical protein
MNGGNPGRGRWSAADWPTREARQATLATAPAHWQPTIWHYLAWRLGMSALRATLQKSEPPTGVN